MLPMVKRPNAVYQTCVQLFEAEQIINPLGTISGKNLRDGVEIDDNGCPVAYHVRKFHPNSTAGAQNTESVRVPAFGAKTGRRNILHLLHRERPGQSRGVPYLAPVIELLKQLDKYSEAELMAAVVSALFTVFINRQAETASPLLHLTSSMPAQPPAQRFPTPTWRSATVPLLT
jgi:capsid protein